MEKDYEQLKIKSYDNWDLFLHESQYPYIGRCYTWAKKDDSKQTTDMTKEERNELFDIVILEWKAAIQKIFGQNWINVASFGNSTPHLHWHLIPRYRTSKIFNGIEYIDSNPDKNYSPYEKKPIPFDDLMKIKGKIMEAIN